MLKEGCDCGTYIEIAPELDRKVSAECGQVSRGERAVPIVLDQCLEALANRALLDQVSDKSKANVIILDELAGLVTGRGDQEDTSVLAIREEGSDFAEKRAFTGGLVLADTVFLDNIEPLIAVLVD
jgi:hypothetical protein